MRISASAPSPLRTLRELWEYRDLLVALGTRDLRLRYRQTALGISWVILQPLATAGIFAFVFGRMAGMDAHGTSYFVFSLAALASWNFFSAIVSRASASLVGQPQLVSKVYFPRLILPFAVLPGALIDLAITFGAFIVIGLATGVRLSAAVATMPLIALLLALLAFGPALIGAALAVRYRDVQHILPVAVQMALFASPVAYSASMVPDAWRWLYDWNPLVAPLELTRWALLGAPAPPTGQVAFSAIVGVVVLLFAMRVFRLSEQSFADEI